MMTETLNEKEKHKGNDDHHYNERLQEETSGGDEAEGPTATTELLTSYEVLYNIFF